MACCIWTIELLSWSPWKSIGVVAMRFLTVLGFFSIFFSPLSFAKIEIDFSSFEAAGRLDVAELFRADLAWLSSLRGDGSASPRHLKMFGGSVDGQVYARYINKRIKKIVYDPGYLFDRVYDASEAMAYYDGGIVHVRQNLQMCGDTFGNYRDPGVCRMLRLGIIIHEAAHYSSGHVNCENSYGEACDLGLNGAHGAELIFQLSIARHCQNCFGNNESRIDIDRYVDGRLGFILNREAKKLLLQDVGGELTDWQKASPGKQWD